LEESPFANVKSCQLLLNGWYGSFVQMTQKLTKSTLFKPVYEFSLVEFSYVKSRMITKLPE